jgi:hypothetical protein
MNGPPFVYCYGIGPEHRPCLVRRQCQRYARLRDEVNFSVPADVRWHWCQSGGEHFLPVDQQNNLNEERQ